VNLRENQTSGNRLA